MKTTNYLAQQLLTGVAALAVMISTAAVRAETVHQVITVVSVKGGARYNTGDKNWHDLLSGQILQVGSVIQTSANGTVDIVLGEPGSVNRAPVRAVTDPLAAGGGGERGASSNVIHIYPDTSLGIDKLFLERTGLDEVSDTQLDLQAGEILGSVKKVSAASKYEVKIPNGVAGIRGTTYHLKATAFVEVVDGSVVLVIVGPDGKTITKIVEAKESYDPVTGQYVPLSENRLIEIAQIAANITGNTVPIYQPGRPVIRVSPDGTISANKP